MNQSYAKSQLFHFYPLRNGAQTIRAAVGQRNHDTLSCLTATKERAEPARGIDYSLSMTPCNAVGSASTASSDSQHFFVSFKKVPQTNSGETSNPIVTQFDYNVNVQELLYRMFATIRFSHGTHREGAVGGGDVSKLEAPLRGCEVTAGQGPSTPLGSSPSSPEANEKGDGGKLYVKACGANMPEVA